MFIITVLGSSDFQTPPRELGFYRTAWQASREDKEEAPITIANTLG